MQTIRLLLYLVLAFSCSSCLADVLARKTTIHDGYYVTADGGMPYETLYYKTPKGDIVERFPEVSKVGYASGYIFIEAKAGYYWFAVKEDNGWNSQDPDFAFLINGPLTATEYQQLVNRLKIGEVDFQYSSY
ncbi:hypothetical protein [Hymenobacter negativus]|uniref:DUF3997 domain-containing protein n=1 Tax=Hymenobacter negativus TaxID=2795026 RepID=A0ABS0Q7Y7_9BACT|nr:hypothetical protein [Hymenobacter negativus]MBH8558468.1 hypothetical protein [Hymenobacter negativus]